MTRARATGCRVLYKHLKPKKERKSAKGYEKRRLALKDIGYEAYCDYLQSDTWKLIRDRRLKAIPYCVLCAQKANQVHHFCYLEPVLLGCADAMLLPMCEECHERVEFDLDAKRTLYSAQRFLVREFNNTGRSAVADDLMHEFRRLKRQVKRRNRQAKTSDDERQGQPGFKKRRWLNPK